MSFHGIVVGLVTLAGLLGCASGRVGTRQDGTPACGVTSGNGLVSRTVSVARGSATFYGIFDREVARIDPAGTIMRKGLFDTEGGQCSGGRLVIKGFFSDTTSSAIGQGQVALPGIFSPTVYRYTGNCSTCEAALGAFALHVLEQEAQQQAQQQQQQQQQRRY